MTILWPPFVGWMFFCSLLFRILSRTRVISKYYEQVGKKCLDITEQIPFEIPENWVWTRLGQIGDWGAGSTPQRGNANYYNGNILWLKTGELNNGIVYDTEEKITQKAFQDCSLRINRIGDVLIAMYGATIGKLT